MTQQEEQIIKDLFTKLAQVASQNNYPIDPEAKSLIQQEMAKIPNSEYYLAQTVFMQNEALKKAESQLKGNKAQEAQPLQATRGGGVGGFLAGAGQAALGIAGGFLLADFVTSMFGGNDDNTSTSNDDDNNSDEEIQQDEQLNEEAYTSDFADYDSGGFDSYDSGSDFGGGDFGGGDF